VATLAQWTPSVGWVPREKPADLAHLLGALAVKIQDQPDKHATLKAIVDSAVALVPGARWAGISLIDGRRVRAEVPSDELVAELDEAQSTLDEGPCLSALREMRTVHVDDMAEETRWPRFSELALRRGARSMLAFQLFVRRGNLGALNLYGDRAGAFTDESLFIGELLAQHASVALMGATTESQLRSAVASRDLIGQAKGLLMLRNDIDGVQAFRLLLEASQDTNMKLVDVAAWLVEQHESRLERHD
jgi:ANTAR domain-containing protein/GAF domain-containing protein